MTTVPTQADIDLEIQQYADLAVPGQVHPDRGYPPYRSSVLRHPRQPLVVVADPDAVELSGPVFGATDITDTDADLTVQHTGEPLGERITVSGRVLDRAGRPVRGQLVEIWQANASGRYAHLRDQHPAPLDPNFTGVGRCLTDDRGGYRFTTVKPGPYPWRNHDNAWRPAHIHFSLFGTSFTQRLVTQMYFPGDPLFRYDPILQSVTDGAARERLVAEYRHELSAPEFSLGYHWDIVLRRARRDLDGGRGMTDRQLLPATASQTVGPFYGYALPFTGGGEMAPAGHPDTVTFHGRVHDGEGRPVPDALLEFWQAAPDNSRAGAPGSLRRDPTTGAVLGRHGVDFTAFGRVATDADGHWSVRTLPPPAEAPYLAVCLFARGLLHHLFTRAYLPGHRDPLLDSLPAGRSATLVAIEERERVLRFDIRLQGAEETVFLDFAH